MGCSASALQRGWFGVWTSSLNSHHHPIATTATCEQQFEPQFDNTTPCIAATALLVPLVAAAGSGLHNNLLRVSAMRATTKTSNPMDEGSTCKTTDQPTDPYYLRHPIRTLTLLFLAWKAILGPTIANSPGLGYDTSTNLLAVSSPLVAFDADGPTTWFSTLLSIIEFSSSGIWNFVRWDAIYFVRVAERGYLFEQEWAWGYGWTGSLRFLGSGIYHSCLSI